MRTETKTIPISLAKLVFTAAELKGLPKHERAFLASSGIAFNDVNFFLSLCLQALNSHNNDEISRQYAVARHLICVRNLSARIFEFYNLLVAYQKKLKRGKLPSNPVVDSILTELATALCEHRFFEVMHWHRNNVTSHYLIDDLPELIEGFPNDHEFVGFEHQLEGNSLSIFAEDIAFFGRMNSLSFSADDVSAFIDWLNDLVRHYKKFRTAFLKNLIRTHFPYRALVAVTANAPPELVRDLHEAALPLFFTREAPISSSTDTQ
jgi:hypothetical protein